MKNIKFLFLLLLIFAITFLGCMNEMVNQSNNLHIEFDTPDSLCFNQDTDGLDFSDLLIDITGSKKTSIKWLPGDDTKSFYLVEGSYEILVDHRFVDSDSKVIVRSERGSFNIEESVIVTIHIVPGKTGSLSISYDDGVNIPITKIELPFLEPQVFPAYPVSRDDLLPVENKDPIPFVPLTIEEITPMVDPDGDGLVPIVKSDGTLAQDAPMPIIEYLEEANKIEEMLNSYGYSIRVDYCNGASNCEIPLLTYMVEPDISGTSLESDLDSLSRYTNDDDGFYHKLERSAGNKRFNVSVESESYSSIIGDDYVVRERTCVNTTIFGRNFEVFSFDAGATRKVEIVNDTNDNNDDRGIPLGPVVIPLDNFKLDLRFCRPGDIYTKNFLTEGFYDFSLVGFKASVSTDFPVLGWLSVKVEAGAWGSIGAKVNYEFKTLSSGEYFGLSVTPYADLALYAELGVDFIKIVEVGAGCDLILAEFNLPMSVEFQDSGNFYMSGSMSFLKGRFYIYAKILSLLGRFAPTFKYTIFEWPGWSAEIPIYGESFKCHQSSPKIQVSSGSNGFNQTDKSPMNLSIDGSVGENHKINFEIKNIGSRNVSIKSIDFSGEKNAIASLGNENEVLNKKLKHGKTLELSVNFKPLVKGKATTKMFIDYGGKEPFEVKITCDGTYGNLSVSINDEVINESGGDNSYLVGCLNPSCDDEMSTNLVFKNTGNGSLKYSIDSVKETFTGFDGTESVVYNSSPEGGDNVNRALKVDLTQGDIVNLSQSTEEGEVVEITFKPKDFGWYRLYIELKVEGDPDYSKQKITLSGLGVSPIMVLRDDETGEIVSPNSIIDFGFSTVYPGPMPSSDDEIKYLDGLFPPKKFTIINKGIYNLHVEPFVICDIPKFHISNNVDDGKDLSYNEEHKFNVNYMPVEKSDIDKESLSIKSNDLRNKDGSFNISFEGKAIADTIVFTDSNGNIIPYENNVTYTYTKINESNNDNFFSEKKIFLKDLSFINSDSNSNVNKPLLKEDNNNQYSVRFDQNFHLDQNHLLINELREGIPIYIKYRPNSTDNTDAKLSVEIKGKEQFIHLKGKVDYVFYRGNSNSNRSHLENGIRSILGKHSGDIYISELAESVDYLDISSKDITDLDLEDIKYLSNLRELLLLNDNNLKTLSSLKHLSKLEKLCLNGSHHLEDSSTSVLGVLYNLKQLEIINTGIKDLSFINFLNSLEVIKAGQNNITDIPMLIGGGALKELNLERNNIKNIEPLVNYRNITSLILDGNEIKSIRSLKNLLNLEKLSLSYNEISNIKDLSGLINIKSLNLSHNEITDLSPLLELDKIKLVLIGGMSSYLFPDDDPTVSNKNNEVIKTLESRGVRVRKDL